MTWWRAAAPSPLRASSLTRTAVVPAARVPPRPVLHGVEPHRVEAIVMQMRGERALGFLHFALDSDLPEPLQLVAARPVSGARRPRVARGGGFRWADDFELVRACDRSRRLEYGVAKTRV
jgi:hypothetical protein